MPVGTPEPPPRARPALGVMLILCILIQIGREITHAPTFDRLAVAATLVALALIARHARGAGLLFLAACIALTGLEAVFDPGWRPTVWKALTDASFFVAFFSALTALRNAAGASPAMAEAGGFLARQPPGRRYLALSAGAQAFAMVLNYGAIQLLGALALTSAQKEPDQWVRETRTRRMLQAIHRGFVSALPWSPLSFAIAIAIAVIPGTSWSQMVVPGLVASALILLIGWALDSLFKPKAPPGSTPPPREHPGSPRALLPLLALMGLLMGLLLAIEQVWPVRVVGLVLIIIPVLSLAWIILQTRAPGAFPARLKTYVGVELPGYGKEILLIATAGYIGATASVLVGPAMAASGLDLARLPMPVLLVALVWIMPILGQLGANPILSLSLIGPLLPPAETLGITPTALAATLICGWAMAGITSPFTATTLLIGRFGGIRAIDVAWVWNRGYFLLTISVLCLWSVSYALLTAP